MELAEQFGVTDETMRRDLQTLAENQLLIRVHGGAKSFGGNSSLQSLTERNTINTEKKKLIAREALKYIESGKTYAFDSSSTVFALVSILPREPIRVITNAYSVINQMVAMDYIDLHATGGRYHAKTQTFVGGNSVEILSRHNINTAFVSCVGLDLERGVSESFEQQAVFKEQLVKYAERVILLVDSTKFNTRADDFFAKLDRIDLMITDSEVDPGIVNEFRKAGCEIEIAD